MANYKYICLDLNLDWPKINIRCTDETCKLVIKLLEVHINLISEMENGRGGNVVIKIIQLWVRRKKGICANKYYFCLEERVEI